MITEKTNSESERKLFCRIGEINVSISGDAEDVLDDYQTLYDVTDVDRENFNPSIRMEVRRSGRSIFGRTRYSIFGDGEELFSHRHHTEVLPYLEWGINLSVIRRHRDHLQLHAATLCYKEQGIILAGSSGDGKSTLAAGLISRGLTYFSDEFALIHPDTLNLHSFPKALCIKSGSFNVMKQIGLPLWRRRHYVKAFKGPVGYIRPQDFASHSILKPCPIRYVIFPKYAAGEHPRLYPISSSQAVFSLAAHSFNRDVFGASTVTILSEVVRGAKCIGLVSGQIDKTCDLLLTKLFDC